MYLHTYTYIHTHMKEPGRPPTHPCSPCCDPSSRNSGFTFTRGHWGQSWTPAWSSEGSQTPDILSSSLAPQFIPGAALHGLVLSWLFSAGSGWRRLCLPFRVNKLSWGGEEGMRGNENMDRFLSPEAAPLPVLYSNTPETQVTPRAHNLVPFFM